MRGRGRREATRRSRDVRPGEAGTFLGYIHTPHGPQEAHLQSWGLRHSLYNIQMNPTPFCARGDRREGDRSRAETDLVTGRTQPVPALVPCLYFGREGEGFVAS